MLNTKPKPPMTAPYLAILLSFLMVTMASTLAIAFSENEHSECEWQCEQSLKIAEIGVQRVITGLSSGNDALLWQMKNLKSPPQPRPNGFWLWTWQTVRDASGNPIGQYRIEINSDRNMPSKQMRLKAYGRVFGPRIDAQVQLSAYQLIQVSLSQTSLSDFAVSTHRLELTDSDSNQRALIQGPVYQADNGDNLNTSFLTDVSSDSAFMRARKLDAQLNGQAIYDSDLILSERSFQLGDPVALDYDGKTGQLNVQGTVFVQGNLRLLKPIQYTGQGGLFINGDMFAAQSIKALAPASYPAQSAVAWVVSGQMKLGQRSGPLSHYQGFFFANQLLTLSSAAVLGNLLAQSIRFEPSIFPIRVTHQEQVISKIGVALPDFALNEIKKNLRWQPRASAHW